MIDATGAPNRRSFLQSVTAAALAGSGPAVLGPVASRANELIEAAPDDNNSGILIIDCHTHPYSEDTQKYPPVAPHPTTPPKGTGTIEHLRRATKDAGVRFAVSIQPRTYYLYDNRFTVEVGRNNRDWLAAVVNLNPDDPRSPELFEQWVKEGSIRGLVSVPGKSNRWHDNDVILQLWERAQRLGITVNINTGINAPKDLEPMLRRFPKVRVALDHSLNMRVGPQMERILAALTQMAAFPNVYTKLSFLPTGTAEKYPFRDLHEPCRQIIRTFGPDRCVWGSNSPCELWCPNVTYAQHLRLITHELGLDQPAKEAILSKTPKVLWFRS
jgi:predicted TIM-barrel fold metal-dependent hydrolase